MKKIFDFKTKWALVALTLSAFHFSFGQSYIGLGGEIPATGPDAGGKSFFVEVFDNLIIEDLDVEIEAHIEGEESDYLTLLSVILSRGVDGEPLEVPLFYHGCDDSLFSTLEWRFSDEADEMAQDACSTEGTYQPSDIGFGGEPSGTLLSNFDGLDAIGTWTISILWKPSSLEDPAPSEDLIVDKLKLIFNNDEDVVATLDENNHVSPLSIYPNPATAADEIKLSWPNQVYSVNIYDLNGRVVFTEANFNETATLNLPQLDKGLYLIKTTNQEGEERTNKIILQ